MDRFSERPGRRELPLVDAPQALAVGPDGRIWLGTSSGEIAAADSIAGDWTVLRPADSPDWIMERLRTSIARIIPLDRETAIAVGEIKGKDVNLDDAVLRTADGGRRWQRVSFGGDASIEDASRWPSGEIWIGGIAGFRDSTKVLFSSPDQGRTWRLLPGPFGPVRISTLSVTADGRAVAGSAWDSLAVTTDTGRSWMAVPTPVAEGVIKGSRDEVDPVIEQAALLGSYIVVVQNGRAYYTALQPVRWRPLPGAPAGFIRYDAERDRLFAVTLGGHVVEYDRGLRSRLLSSGPLSAPPVAAAAHAGALYLLDRQGALYRMDGSRTVYGFPLGAAASAPPPGLSAWGWSSFRVTGAHVWGASPHHVYHSGDGGRTWTRLSSVPTAIRSFVARDSDAVLLWDGHAHNWIYSRREARLRPVPTLQGYDVVAVVQTPEAWYAYGGMQYEQMGRLELSRTVNAGEFAGSRRDGFVLVSRDRGLTWSLTHEWRGSGVAGMFVFPNGDLVLSSYLGAIRKLVAVNGLYRPVDLISVSRDTWGRVPYVQRVGLIFFRDSLHGFLDGWIHLAPPRRYVTADGGRSWAPDSVQADHFVAGFPVPGGYCGVTPWGVYRLGPEGETLLFTATMPSRREWGPVTDVSLRDDGRLLVVLNGVQRVLVDPRSGAASSVP